MAGNTDDMPAALMLADVVIHASTEPEAFGRVVIGAQAMARLMIASDLGGPVETVDDGETGWRVVIKSRQALSTAHYPFNPLDAIGWHGDLAVCRINVRDLRPLMSHRYHLPPSAHTTFVAGRFIVCTFVPRPLESDPEALRLTFFHSNDDYEEAIFYHKGSFFSRDNIHPGMMSFHPCGFTHGPHPKALQSMLVPKKPGTDEYAVMIDARDALDVAPAASAVEFAGYADSWKTSP